MLHLSPRARVLGCVGSLILAAVVFLDPLLALVERAWMVELDSYILIVPFITAYLLRIKGALLPRNYSTSLTWAASFALAGGLMLLLAWLRGDANVHRGAGDEALALTIAAFLCWIAGIGFFFLGRDWMASAAFPVAFLVFLIPLPLRLVAWLENASKAGSAEVAGWFFDLSGLPNLRDGFYFHLPNFTIEVAQECSGIRSSLILFITGLLASYLFLRGLWPRLILVVLVIPLGLLRNGFRIWVIGELCAQIGPEMIHSAIHKHGGPVFFVLSLVPLLALAWWLRRGEKRRFQTLPCSKIRSA